MSELWLKFRDQNGSARRLQVRGGDFTIGRHSENDLSIPIGDLSRQHVKIERFGDMFVVSDLGSSNGTMVNGTHLKGPMTVKHGDMLNLGGSLEIEVEIESAFDGRISFFEDKPTPPKPGEIEPELMAAVPEPVVQSIPAADTGTFPKSFLYLAPIFGVLIVAVIGLTIYMSSRKTVAGPVDKVDDFEYSSNDSNQEKPPKGEVENAGDVPDGKDPVAVNDGNPQGVNNSPLPGPGGPTPSADTGNTEQNAARFMRAIAQNDPRAFLTSVDAKTLNIKIKQFTGSGVLADNINSARRNAAQIKSLAVSKNLKPQFLAAAALTKLGGQRGDTLTAAQSMADVLEKLGTQVGNEFANDALLMIAAYDQGASGDFLKMRNMLQDFVNRSPESSRTIRTIWFLKKNNKITQAEFDMALTFLAIGTIAQNPKEYGVKTEALNL